MAEVPKYLKIGETYWTESPTGERKVVTDPGILRQLVSGSLTATPATLTGAPVPAAPAAPAAPAVPADATASFLAGLTKTIEAAKPPEAAPLPQPPPPIDEGLLARQREVGAARIGQRFDITREEIEKAQRLGYAEIGRARQLLGLAPVAVRNQIERFQEGVERFAGNISRSLERLNLEEQSAIEQNDLQYLQAIRQAKVDAYNMATDFWKMQRQIQMDAWGIMKDQFSMALSGAQFAAGREEFGLTYGLQERQFQQQVQTEERKRAADRLEFIIQGAAGKGFESLSPESKASLALISSTLNVPLDSLKSILDKKEVKHVVKGDTAVYFFDDAGNLISSFGLPTAPGVEGGIDTWFRAFLNGDITSPSGAPAKFETGVQDWLNQLRQGAAANLILTYRADLPTTLKGFETKTIPEIREEILRKVATALARSPSTAAEYLGSPIPPNATPFVEGIANAIMQSSDLQDLVVNLVPAEYIAKQRAKASNPFTMFMEGFSMPQGMETLRRF